MAQPSPKSAERVLIVEDDQDLGELLSELLTMQGYQPEWVADGASAVKRVTAEPIDAVILDVMIPEMDGFQVCRTLKFRRETNLIPILMLTALDGDESRRHGLKVGADRYLTKPFDPARLLSELRATLDHRKSMQNGKLLSKVQLQMQSDSRLREQLNDLLSELFRLTPLSEEEIGRIRYAAMEMVGNAIEWGNRHRKELPVSISYELTADEIKFVVTDQGTGFNPNNVPHAASEDDPVSHMDVRQKLGLRDGGFGIMIAKGMVDKVEYNDAGNEVRLTKFLRSPEAQADAAS